VKAIHWYTDKNAFRGFRPGQMITFRVPNGLSFTGKQEYKVKRGKIIMCFENHVVANHGSFGQVVNDQNCVTKPKRIPKGAVIQPGTGGLLVKRGRVL
jgi:hypothetical protein